MTNKLTFEEHLVSKGVSLQSLGISELGLLRDDALQGVEVLRTSSTPILGGDVYFIREGSVEQAFANWHTDQHHGEGRREFAERSCLQTAEYVETFPLRPDVSPVFVFVVSADRE